MSVYTRAGTTEDYFFKTFQQLLENPTAAKPPYVFYIEDDTAYLQFALAGFTKEDLKISVNGNLLYIEGDNTENEKVHEKFQNKFKRSFKDTDGKFDLKKTEVNFADGLLSIVLPPKEKTMIDINIG